MAAGAQARWRETCKHTKVGQDFLDRFGCFTIIGPEGGFQSGQLWAWAVYMPLHIYYPWNEHPAEESYLVIAGEAEFMRAGQAPRFLNPGDVIFHAAQQPHALQTHEAGVLAQRLWYLARAKRRPVIKRIRSCKVFLISEGELDC